MINSKLKYFKTFSKFLASDYETLFDRFQKPIFMIKKSHGQLIKEVQAIGHKDLFIVIRDSDFFSTLYTLSKPI